MIVSDLHNNFTFYQLKLAKFHTIVSNKGRHARVSRARACTSRGLEAESLSRGPGAASLDAISSNQAKANYKFNSELCAGDN